MDRFTQAVSEEAAPGYFTHLVSSVRGSAREVSVAKLANIVRLTPVSKPNNRKLFIFGEKSRDPRELWKKNNKR